eukprot:Tamp_09041.p1 GENE.Tamp_09041~~Tamp_09041.p1  ORF type:complete len:421 (-),score=97.06 Tamp_09041:972-2078(-)
MHGVQFLHGATGQTQRFDFEAIKQTLDVCLEWAEVHGPEDARAALGVQQLAAVRAWTATPMCYVLTSVLRSPGRTRESVQPVLPFARLLFTALHRLPEQYIFKPSEGAEGTLYRAERGVMPTWDAKMRGPDATFSFYVLTSFSRDPAVLTNFKGEGTRTVFIIHGAAGWKLKAFSPYDEDEVLLEPVCHFQVLNADKFDENHREVKMGEVKVGLHRAEGRLRPGTELLADPPSPVKALEMSLYRSWLETEQRKRDERGEAHGMDLVFSPFPQEEWLARGNKVLPKKDKDRKMSVLGKGAFMCTYRMQHRLPPASGAQCVRGFAVKMMEREDMERQGVTEDDVRREARTLELMRHSHVAISVCSSPRMS